MLFKFYLINKNNSAFGDYFSKDLTQLKTFLSPNKAYRISQLYGMPLCWPEGIWFNRLPALSPSMICIIDK